MTQKDVDAAVQKGIEAQAKAEAAAPPDATVAYQAIQPSLVLITTKRTTAAGAEQGSGAGVIVKTDGTILTALHVVSGADSVTVSYTDGTSSPATVVTQTPDSDIATLLPEHPPADARARRPRRRRAGGQPRSSPSATRSASPTPSPPASCRPSTAP